MSIHTIERLVAALEPYAKKDPEAKAALKEAKRMLRDSVPFFWWVEDVKEVAPKLTKAQCREVLEAAHDNHDATIGVNWDVLAYHAEGVGA